MPVNHNEACAAAIARWHAAYKAYADQWPSFCRTCQGWGGHGSSFDPSPSGVGLSAGSFPDFDTCPDCVDQNVCPRCGATDQLAAEADFKPEDDKCNACGWTPKDSGVAEQPECLCWIADEPTQAEVDAALADRPDPAEPPKPVWRDDRNPGQRHEEPTYLHGVITADDRPVATRGNYKLAILHVLNDHPRNGLSKAFRPAVRSEGRSATGADHKVTGTEQEAYDSALAAGRQLLDSMYEEGERRFAEFERQQDALKAARETREREGKV